MAGASGTRQVICHVMLRANQRLISNGPEEAGVEQIKSTRKARITIIPSGVYNRNGSVETEAKWNWKHSLWKQESLMNSEKFHLVVKGRPNTNVCVIEFIFCRALN